MIIGPFLSLAESIFVKIVSPFYDSVFIYYLDSKIRNKRMMAYSTSNNHVLELDASNQQNYVHKKNDSIHSTYILRLKNHADHCTMRWNHFWKQVWELKNVRIASEFRGSQKRFQKFSDLHFLYQLIEFQKKSVKHYKLQPIFNKLIS